MLRRGSLFLVVVLLGFAQLALCQTKPASVDANASKRKAALATFMQAIADSSDGQLLAFVNQHCLPVVYDKEKGELPLGEVKPGADIRLLVMVGDDSFVDKTSMLTINHPSDIGGYYTDLKILAVNGDPECSDLVKSVKYAQLAYSAMVICTEKLPDDLTDRQAYVASRSFSFSYPQLIRRGKEYGEFIEGGVRVLKEAREKAGKAPGEMVMDSKPYADFLNPLFLGPPASKQEEAWRLTFIRIDVLLQDIQRNGGADKETLKWKTLKMIMLHTQ